MVCTTPVAARGRAAKAGKAGAHRHTSPTTAAIRLIRRLPERMRAHILAHVGVDLRATRLMTFRAFCGRKCRDERVLATAPRREARLSQGADAPWRSARVRALGWPLAAVGVALLAIRDAFD